MAATLLVLAGCSSTAPKPAAPTTTTPTIPVSGPITYTVEPFDMDGSMGVTMTVTQNQFGGRMCPCVKIPYRADGLHNQQGADAIWSATPKFNPGDTLMGFSNGVQVIALLLSQHTLPPGVHVLLAGLTFAENKRYGSNGIPLDIVNDVTMVANEYDGWSDSPDLTNAANYALAEVNAVLGAARLHYYANADVSNPANIVVQQGNITAILIPTQGLPRDASQRPKINTAYSRPSSTADQQAAAGAEQVPQPNPVWAQNPEPVLALP